MILERECHVLVMGRDYAALEPFKAIKELHRWQLDFPSEFWDHVKDVRPTHVIFYVYKKPA